MSEVIRAEGLVKEYQQRVGRLGRVAVRAVDGVTLSLGSQECIGLVGESGCGKSTLARMMVGLEETTEGHVLHEGTRVTDRSGWTKLRESVQYVFQDPYGSLPSRMTIGTMLDDVLRVAGLADGAERRRRVVRTLELVGIRSTALDKYPAEFSGGERQRIGVARALVMEPEVILLDEVTSSLDVSIQAQLLNLIIDLRQGLGVGFMFVSHDLRVVNYLVDRVLVMYLGRVVESGPKDKVMTAPLHPYTQGLLESIPDTRGLLETGRRQRLAWIRGEPPSRLQPSGGCAFAPRCPRAEEVCRTTDPEPVTIDGRTARCHFATEAGNG